MVFLSPILAREKRQRTVELRIVARYAGFGTRRLLDRNVGFEADVVDETAPAV